MNKCRSCKNKKLVNLFSLGNLSFTGKFPKKKSTNIKKRELGLIMCSKCFLVQLNKNFDLKYLYNPDYGYRTGINKTMTNHMNNIKKMLSRKSKLISGDHVLDIASNDATLLNFYNKNIVKVGIDPLVNKYIKYYKKIDYKISDFFSSSKILKKKIKNKFKIITALSVFYDAKDPNQFLKDVNKLLSEDGIFLLEHADLLSIIKLKMFDTICHEHLYYYSTKVIIDMVLKHNLRVFDLKRNNINGGSTQYFICKKNSKYKTNYKIINKTLNEEQKFRLESKKTFLSFFKKINNIKSKTIKYLDSIILKNKKIHGYGASTKGNVLLQYFNINEKYIKFIADRNPKKHNHYTPGTKIKIISEKKSRKLSPDYYFALPWHFKEEILKRENKIRTKGCKFIFPLPNLKIY
jgi:2-polyprenyl-3-methyl-5-hydroxy-6-metoxy-1,4-benzoquinol methylase